MPERLEARVRDYIQKAREERGDVAMGCVRVDAQPHFVGIVYEKPGGSSAQFEASYDPTQGFVMLDPEGEVVEESDPEKVFQRFLAVIDSIPEQRRETVAQMVAEWRAQGIEGPRLRVMLISYNSQYEGTRGGHLAPEELRYATQLVAS